MKKILLLSCTLLLLFFAQAQPTSGTSMTTDGSTQFACTPNGMMDGFTTFTVETWIKTTENRSFGTILPRPTIIGTARSSSADNDFGIFTNGGAIGIHSGLGIDNELLTAVTINDNQWHHIAAVKNGTVLNLFVDGNNVGNISVGASNSLVTSDAPLTIGARGDNANYGVGANAVLVSTFHQGEFAETRFSSNARYSANFTPAGSFTTDANTVALYHYGACQKIISTDASTNANFLSGKFAAPACATGLPFTKAINYNGVDQSAFLPAGVMNGLTNFTIEGWVKSTDLRTSPTSELWRAPWIFGKEEPNGNSGDIMITTQAGFANFGEEFIGGSGYTETLTKYFICDNQWHHVAASADGTTCRYFIDGILQGSKPVDGGLQVTATDKLALMNRTNTNESAHSGLLEEVRFSNIGRYTASFTPPTAAFTNNAATVALYHSNDCPGTNTLTDASSNGNNATLNNFGGSCDGLTVTKPGSGNAVSFGGEADVDDYVKLPVNSTSTSYTVELWVKPTSIKDGIHLWEGSNGESIPDLSGSSNIMSFYVNNASAVSTGLLSIGMWQHIACTYDAATSTQSVYVNGVLTGTASVVSTNSLGSYISLGNRTAGYQAFARAYPGNMDEVKIWNIALTQTQIRDRMCHKIESTDALYANLLSYYNFDETAGNTCYNKVNETSSYAFLTNGPTRLTSTAPIGNTSASSYTGAAATATLTNTPRGDAFTATLTAGGAAGIQVFSVNQAPNTSTGVTGIGDNNAYFGTFVVNGTSPAYTAVYNYNGVSITKNSDNRLFKRTDNAATTWADALATNNTGAKTLTATGQNTEYILGSTGTAAIVTTVANLSPCKGSIIPVTFVPSGVLQAGNTFTAQLSNAAGSFASPVAIGSIAITAATATPYTISVTIPANTVDGTAYRIRIVSSSPAVTGAANTGNMSISTPAIPTITAGGATTFCAGGSVTLTSSAATTYLWSNGATTQSINVNTSGTFTLTTTNASGCVSAASLSTTVTVNALPAKPTITAGGATTFCQGGSVVLTCAASTAYLWSTGATTQSITVSASGSYTVNRINASGCSTTSNATVVTVNALPGTPTVTAGGATTFCAGGSVLLTSSAATTYLWSTGATTQSITVNASGNYTVTGTNANGCTSAASAAKVVTVNANPVPTTTPSGTVNIVSPNTVNISVNETFSSYLWSTGATTQSITVGTTGSYSATVTNASGCTGTTAAVAVNVSSAMPSVSIAGKNVNEGNSGATALKLTVTLSSASASTVTVQYATANKTATAGSDYTAVTNSLSFAPGQVSKKVTVQILGDVTVEPNEDLYVILSSPVNATLDAADTATVRIKNDDVAAAMIAATNESSAKGTVTIKLSPNPAKDLLNMTGLSAAKGSIIITDLQGKTMIKQIITTSTATVNISRLATGMYMLSYLDGNTYKTIKFIKE